MTTTANQMRFHTQYCHYDEDDVIAAAPASRCAHASIAHARGAASALSIPCAARCMASMAERTMIGSAITAGGMPLVELLPLLAVAVAVAVAGALTLVLLPTLVPLPSFEPAGGRVVNAAVAFNVSPASAPPRRTSSPHGCAASR